MGEYLKSRPKRAIASAVFLSALITVLAGSAIPAGASSGVVTTMVVLWFLSVACTASLAQLAIESSE